MLQIIGADLIDADFCVRHGEFSRIRELTDLQLLERLEVTKIDVQKADSDRRLNQTTRDSRKQEAILIQDACKSEIVRRKVAEIEVEKRKKLLSCLLGIGKPNNVIIFLGGRR